MEVMQACWSVDGGWNPPPCAHQGRLPDVTLVFGATGLLERSDLIDELARVYGSKSLVGCSTAGEILGDQVRDDTLVVSAIYLENTEARLASASICEPATSHLAGRELAEQLASPDLTHVLVLSDGIHINGSELVRGLNERLPESVVVTGGLASDGIRLEETRVLFEGRACTRLVAAVGFYGSRLSVGFGSLGGWDPFGPERLVTSSEGNQLFELDGRSALELYRRYLGDYADRLPASGLLFPLSVRPSRESEPLVRTVVAIDDEGGSMTFAGNIPQGGYARFMKANFDRLIDGAVGAARKARLEGDDTAELAILISCIGRKLVLQQRVEEEIESARDVIGGSAAFCGFYSNGEISPLLAPGPCDLHNQTLTITTLREI